MIVISPVVLSILLLVILNFCISFGNRSIMKKGYIIVSSILAASGIVGAIVIRPLLVLRLERNLESGRLGNDFIVWALGKFDLIATATIITTCVIVILCILYTYRKKGDGLNCSIFINTYRILLFIVMLWYSLGTINKKFDLAAYIMTLAVCQIFILYVPIIVERIKENKADTPFH